MKKIKLFALILITFICFGINVNAYDYPTLNSPSIRWHQHKCTWNAVDRATSYEIYILEGNKVIHSERITNTEYNFTQYITDKTKKYYFKVVAKNETTGEYSFDSKTLDPYTFSDFDLDNYPKLKDAMQNGITVNYKEPTQEESQWMMSIIMEDLIDQDNYGIYGMNTESPNVLEFGIQAGMTELLSGHINIKYNKTDTNVLSMTKKISDKMNEHTTPYIVDDLYAINFYLSGGNAGEWNGPLYSNVIKFSKELIEVTEGKNVTFRLPAGAGEDSPLFHSRMGEAVMYYNGFGLSTVHASVTTKNVIYVPEGTTNYLETAQKRLDDYLGKGKVNIQLIDTVENYKISLQDEYDQDLLDYVFYVICNGRTSDGNVYNIKLNGIDYPFIIIETTDEIDTPSYIGTNIEETAKITSDSSLVPLDTLLSIKDGDTTKYKDAITTKIYGAYDISLYSNSKKTNITKLNDGTFKVSIKVDDSLNGKTLIAYYKTSDGKLEEHEAKVENGFASFITTHFSEYVLAEKMINNESSINPKTGDKLVYNILLSIISLIGLAIIKLKVKVIK